MRTIVVLKAAKIDFSNSGMDKTDVKVLAELLKDNTTVTELDASSNGLGAEGAMAFGEVLKTNNTLTLLDVSDNEIGGYEEYDEDEEEEVFRATPEGPAALAGGLKSTSTVQQLNVSSNSLDQASKDGLNEAKPRLTTLML